MTTFAELWQSGSPEVRYLLDERAAIQEFDGGLTRIEAEIQTALDYHKSRWDRMRAATEV